MNIKKMSLEELKLLREEINFAYYERGYQFHEMVGEDFTWALVHCRGMMELYLDGTTPAPYEKEVLIKNKEGNIEWI